VKHAYEVYNSDGDSDSLLPFWVDLVNSGTFCIQNTELLYIVLCLLNMSWENITLSSVSGSLS